MLYSSPTARSDAEESELQRGILMLGELLRNTSTPMGQLISQDPEKPKVLGAGRRVSTLRSRIRTTRQFLAWLSASHGVLFPTKTEHCSGFLEVRASEPSTRRAIKEAHRSMVFLELTAGVDEQQRVTGTSIYKTIFDEILISTAPGRSTRHAPRMMISMLTALEILEVDTKALPFVRLNAWWILLQNWGTLRFSDHRGLRPQDVRITNNTLDAKLSRSKTTGDDRNVYSRPVRVESCCFVLKPSWISTGWTLLHTTAPFERDNLLLTSAENYMSCKQQELRYELGYALQNRVLALAVGDKGKLFKYPVTSHWTPHSGRCFMPTSTAALRYEKSQRDFLGGWSARGSGVYARVARVRIGKMQRAVVTALQSSSPELQSQKSHISLLNISRR